MELKGVRCLVLKFKVSEGKMDFFFSQKFSLQPKRTQIRTKHANQTEAKLELETSKVQEARV